MLLIWKSWLRMVFSGRGRSYTNTRRDLLQGDTEMERCDTLMVPIFQRSRLRRRVVSFFIRPEQDRLQVRPTGAPHDAPRQRRPAQRHRSDKETRGPAWLCLATLHFWLEFLAFQCIVTSRYSRFKKRWMLRSSRCCKVFELGQ